MPVYLNAYLCLFLLCSSGAIARPLQRAKIHPAVASVFFLLAMFFSIFEEVELFPRLYVNIGGFFFQMAAGLLLLAQGPHRMRRRALALVLFTGLIAYLSGQLLSDFTEAVFHGVPWVTFAVCILTGTLLAGEHHGALLCAQLGYFLSSFLDYFLNVLPQGWITITLGGGAEQLPITLLLPATLLFCELLRLLSLAYQKQRAKAIQKKQAQPTPEPTSEPASQSTP